METGRTPAIHRGAPRPTPPSESAPRPELATSSQAPPEKPAEPARPVDPLTKALVILRRTLPMIAGGVSLQMERREVKFVYFSAREEISGTVALSLRIPETAARFAYIEQRVTLDIDAIEGAEPSAHAALLLAANAVNLYAPGVRCCFDNGRLRFRRELLLGAEAPLEPDDLQRQVDLLLAIWPAVFAALRDVQEGAPWNEALAFLVRPRVADEERQEALRTMLTTEGYVLEEAEDKRLLVGSGDEQVELIAGPNQVEASFLVRAWECPKKETKNLKKRKPTPEIERLLADLNRQNECSFFALAWDPKRGVVAHAALSEPAFLAPRLDAFLKLVRAARDLHFPSLPGEGEGAPKKTKSWLPWKR